VNVTTTLFDMDGLLLDSEILWHEAELEILGDLGVPIEREGTRATKGMFVAEVVDHWFAIAPWSGPSREEVVEQILQRVGDLVETKGVMMPGALRAIDLADERGRIAVASSTPRSLIERCLRHFDLLGRFEAIATAADEPYGKPHPGVFLTAATLLEARPAQCLVFEDSGAGVLAAKAARMVCVAVPVVEERQMGAFAIADLVLASLEDLSVEWLDTQFSR
jgi:sugar-phosphatase